MGTEITVERSDEKPDEEAEKITVPFRNTRSTGGNTKAKPRIKEEFKGDFSIEMPRHGAKHDTPY
jgi:hypothetical protein